MCHILLHSRWIPSCVSTALFTCKSFSINEFEKKKNKNPTEISNSTGVSLVGAGSPALEGILCGLPECASAGCSSLTWGWDSNLGTAVGEAGVAGGTKRLSLRCASATALVISCGCARLLTVSLADVELALCSFSRTFALKDLLE